MARCVAVCPRCKLPSDEFLVAPGGMGGDFQLFQHTKSGALYRHNRTVAQYNPEEGALELKAIEAHAGGAHQLRSIPGELTCKVCATTYSGEPCSAVAETAEDVFVVTSGKAA
jgi:hypothetical protein